MVSATNIAAKSIESCQNALSSKSSPLTQSDKTEAKKSLRSDYPLLISDLLRHYNLNKQKLLFFGSASLEIQRVELEQKQVFDFLYAYFWKLIYKNKHFPGFSSLSIDELKSVSVLALHSALRSFNSGRYTEDENVVPLFVSYFIKTSRTKLTTELAQYFKISFDQYRKISEYKKLERKALQAHGRAHSFVEVAKLMKLTDNEKKTLEQNLNIFDSNTVSMSDIDYLKAEKYSEPDFMPFEIQALIEKLRKRMPPRYFEILVMAYCEHKKSKEIGEALGITPSKVASYRDRALKIALHILTEDMIKPASN